MTTYPAPICFSCKHFREPSEQEEEGTEGITYRCSAYPEGIPAEIILSTVDHTQPYKGDNGIRFTERAAYMRL